MKPYLKSINYIYMKILNFIKIKNISQLFPSASGSTS